MLKPRFFIQKRSGLPIFRLNPAVDNYFFPFFPAAGVAAKELNNELTYNSVQWEKVFTGRDSLVFKWLGSEGPLSAYDPTTKKIVTDPDLFTRQLIFKRNIRIGDFYVGKILNQSQSTIFIKKGVFLNQNIKATITVYFSDDLIWDQENHQVRQENLYLFWKIPESSNTDIFFITNCQIFLTTHGRYLCHVITFSSVGEQLQRIGKFLDQRIQYSCPGESPILPQIKPALIWKSEDLPGENDLLFYDEYKKNSKNEFVFEKKANSKQVYVNKFLFENARGVKSIQFEFEGLVAFQGLEIHGYKKNLNNMIVNRSTKIFLHKNIPVEVSPLQKTAQFDDEFVILGNWKAMLRFWFANFRGDAGLFFNPKATRDEQGVIEHVAKTWGEVLTPEIVTNVYSAQQNAQQNVDLVGIQNMALIPFTKLFREKLKYDKPSKSILPKNIKKMNVNLCEFLNINQFLNDPIRVLEFGVYQLKNNKRMISSIISDVSKFLGIGVPVLSSGRELRTGMAAINQIGNTTMSWLPDELFTNKNVIKISSSFNFAISKQFLIFLKASLPTYSNGSVNPAFIPFEVFKETKWNYWSNVISTHNLNNSVNFELTNSLDLVDENNVLSKSTCQDLSQGTKFVPTNKIVTFLSDDDFVIQMLAFKVLGFRNCVITFRDKNNKLINYFKTETQNKFSGNAKDIISTIWFDWTRDNNISLDKKFRNNFSSITELNQFNHNKILVAKNTAEFEKILLENLNDNFIFSDISGAVQTGHNLPSEVENLFDIAPVILTIKNIFKNLPEKKDFWTIWKNPLNVNKQKLLETIFAKVTFVLKWNLRRIPKTWRPWKLPNIWRFKDNDRILAKTVNSGEIWWQGTAPGPQFTNSKNTLFFSTPAGELYDKFNGSYSPEIFLFYYGKWGAIPPYKQDLFWTHGSFEAHLGWQKQNFYLEKREKIYEKRSIRSQTVTSYHGRGSGRHYKTTNSTETYFTFRNNYYSHSEGWHKVESECQAALYFDEGKEEVRIKISFRNVKLKFQISLLNDFESVKTELWPEITNIKISNEL